MGGNDGRSLAQQSRFCLAVLWFALAVRISLYAARCVCAASFVLGAAGWALCRAEQDLLLGRQEVARLHLDIITVRRQR